MFQVISFAKNIIMVLGTGDYDYCLKVVKDYYPEVHYSLLPDKTYNTFTGAVQINTISDDTVNKILSENKKDKDLDNIIEVYKQNEGQNVGTDVQNNIIRNLVDSYEMFLQINKNCDNYWKAVNEYIDEILVGLDI